MGVGSSGNVFFFSQTPNINVYGLMDLAFKEVVSVVTSCLRSIFSFSCGLPKERKSNGQFPDRHFKSIMR